MSRRAAPEPDAGPSPAGETPPPAARIAPVLRPEDADGFVGVLRRTDFRLLWAAQVCSQLADKFLMFTLLVLVYTLSGRSTGSSLVMVAYILPSVLLSAPAGVYADRHDKRSLMLGTNILRGGLILLIPLSQHLPPCPTGPGRCWSSPCSSAPWARCSPPPRPPACRSWCATSRS